jgi:ribosomal protein L19E
MKHRGRFSASQRKARSELTRIVHDKELIRASLVTMTRVCGNPNCRCAKGQKHVNSYLSRSKGGGTEKLFVPKRYEARVKRWIENYRRLRELAEEISDDLWAAVKERRFG